MNIFEIEHIWVFLALLPFVAFMYATVGHGGASGYLAMMALFNFAPAVMKPTALLLNLFVAAIAFYHYWKNGHFNMKLFLSFTVASVPFAFLGGLIEVDPSLYRKILGVLLIFAILRMLNLIGKEVEVIKEIKIYQGLIIGALIGFFSGLIGIGGGIILTPVILLLHWGKMKEAAAVSALFIWFNSASGMAGQLSSGVIIDSQAFILVGIAVIGGYIGAYYGSRKFNNNFLRYGLAIVFSVACLKLLFA